MPQEPVKPRSFWGRVGEFIKNPTQDWALTRHENALRELQEQEHQRAREEQRKLDSFIRKRELAALRRLRKQQASGEAPDLVLSDLPDTGAGVPQAPQREATLRKINEIERAMVQDSTADPRPRVSAGGMQSAGGPPASPPVHSTQPLSFPLTDALSRHAGATSLPGALQPTVPAPTQLAATQLAPTRIGADEVAPAPYSHSAGLGWSASTGSGDSSQSMAVDVQEGVSSSPLFDQACMDFANGHDKAAEKALLEAISGSPERKLENEFWLALFDLYRAGGDVQRFEALVSDYVERFQSSAPSWGGTGMPRPATPQAAAQAPVSFTALGECDAAQARALLQLARSGADQVSLDFNALTGFAEGAQQPLHEALKAINAAVGCVVEVSGLDHLLESCTVHSPAMQSQADSAWWGARLEALRLAAAQEAFESTALDYCVTYEISPPSWEPSRARVRLAQSGDAQGVESASLLPGSPGSRLNSRFSNTESDAVARARLDGEIRGGSEDFLKPLDQAARGHSAMVVDLAGLRRLDFSSAGIVLNWVMAQSNAGLSVRFEGTHRLIAGLFAILGISSVAQVELRKA